MHVDGRRDDRQLGVDDEPRRRQRDLFRRNEPDRRGPYGVASARRGLRRGRPQGLDRSGQRRRPRNPEPRFLGLAYNPRRSVGLSGVGSGEGGVGSGEWGGGSGEWGVGSGEWEIGSSVFPHPPFPIPHSPLPISPPASLSGAAWKRLPSIYVAHPNPDWPFPARGIPVWLR